ncbi:MAG: hypothetical protein KC613_09045 [Myxococcales bacterium]|nr:hypothetical protein [Myxococcales bacterium]
MRASSALLWLTVLGLAGCSTTDPEQAGSGETLGLTLGALTVTSVLPGTEVRVEGTGFLPGMAFEAAVVGQISGTPIELPVAVERLDDVSVQVRFVPEAVQGVPEGDLTGVLKVEGRLGSAAGRAETGVVAPLMHAVVPEFDRMANAVFPQSPAELRGRGFIGGSEGRTLLVMTGTYTREADGVTRRLGTEAEAQPPANVQGWLRDRAEVLFDPSWVGHEPGAIEAEVRLVNEGQGWTRESLPVDVVLSVLPPTVGRVETTRASRGEAVRITGNGFLGASSGGSTVLRLTGRFQPAAGGEPVELGAGGLELDPVWESGQSLVFSMRVNYAVRGAQCLSDDLGATPGLLDGAVTPVTVRQGQVVEGDAYPLRFQILPPKQVIYLRFLPSFTDSLRLFGLRNVSALVRRRIVEVVERDYAGINLEVRDTQPDDWLEYSTVEIGGPDPNEQGLFGLDNTAGLDSCNNRLDDLLAGRNAESGSYGGIFVESFLVLSATRGVPNELNDERLPGGATAGEVFDEIFDPVIAEPVATDEFPGGSRHAVIDRAINTLGNLVGNTVTHEIGHSLGLPVAPGCGMYHNAPGPQQIMDCGVDRPFSERAELEAGGHAVWTPENRAYLERILPLE